jgi:hypothetical protein
MFGIGKAKAEKKKSQAQAFEEFKTLVIAPSPKRNAITFGTQISAVSSSGTAMLWLVGDD